MHTNEKVLSKNLSWLVSPIEIWECWAKDIYTQWKKSGDLIWPKPSEYGGLYIVSRGPDSEYVKLGSTVNFRKRFSQLKDYVRGPVFVHVLSTQTVGVQFSEPELAKELDRFKAPEHLRSNYSIKGVVGREFYSREIIDVLVNEADSVIRKEPKCL